MISFIQNIARSILKNEINELNRIISVQAQTILDLKNPKVNPMEAYYNNKYPKVNLNYRREETDGTYFVDLRNFIVPNDYTVQIISGKNDDEKALNGLKWVINNITYVEDKTDYGYDEYWAYAYQTLKRKKGDCEDGAILLYNILLRSGVPYWKIRLNAGDVKGGGHCYLTYYYETGQKWVVLDWCYWPNELEIKYRKDYKDEEENYMNVWFSWNRDYCFSTGLNTKAKQLVKTKEKNDKK